MPYNKTNDLPDRVKDNLPVHAQEIFMNTFNNAWEKYDQDEVICNKIAWSAVKREYIKNYTSKWVKNNFSKKQKS